MSKGCPIPIGSLELCFGDGAVNYAVWFSKCVDANGWTNPKLIALARRLFGDEKGYMHSSQIQQLKLGGLKSPGPRFFASLAALGIEIDKFQKGELTADSPSFKGLEHLIEDAQIMRDDEGNPASLGFHFEVFVGWRKPPIPSVNLDYSPEQAQTISSNAAYYIRRLMTAHNIDIFRDIHRLAETYSSSEADRTKFADIIREQTTWLPEELDYAMRCLCHVLKKHFKQDRKPLELLNTFLKS